MLVDGKETVSPAAWMCIPIGKYPFAVTQEKGKQLRIHMRHFKVRLRLGIRLFKTDRTERICPCSAPDKKPCRLVACQLQAALPVIAIRDAPPRKNAADLRHQLLPVFACQFAETIPGKKRAASICQEAYLTLRRFILIRKKAKPCSQQASLIFLSHIGCIIDQYSPALTTGKRAPIFDTGKIFSKINHMVHVVFLPAIAYPYSARRFAFLSAFLIAIAIRYAAATDAISFAR